MKTTSFSPFVPRAAARALLLLLGVLGCKEESHSEHGKYVGIYRQGGEALEFFPCARSGTWAMEPDLELGNRYARVVAGDAGAPSTTGWPLTNRGTPVHLAVTGALRGPGQYGHLGAYEWSFHPEIIHDIHLLTTEECVACKNDGLDCRLVGNASGAGGPASTD